MCRSCGHIDPADSRGRCPVCSMFFDLAIVPRAEAEQIARQWRRRILRRRLVRLTLVLAVVGSATIWALGAYFDLGPRPPSATTNISASIGPHTWAQIGRTPENSGFTPEAAPFPQHVSMDVSHLQASSGVAGRRGLPRLSHHRGRSHHCFGPTYGSTRVGIPYRLAVQLHSRRGGRCGDFRHSPRPRRVSGPTDRCAALGHSS